MRASKSITTTLTPDSFWESVNILITKPHVLNKRLWGSKLWFKYSCKPNCPTWKVPTTFSQLIDLVTSENNEQHAVHILHELNVVKYVSDPSAADGEIEVLLTELLPKNYTDKQAYQLVCLQKEKSTVTFFNVTPASHEQNLCPIFSYTICLDNHEIILTVPNGMYHLSQLGKR